jgi:hypothetical protein
VRRVACSVGVRVEPLAQLDDVAVAVLPIVEEGEIVADRVDGRRSHTADIVAAKLGVTEKESQISGR